MARSSISSIDNPLGAHHDQLVLIGAATGPQITHGGLFFSSHQLGPPRGWSFRNEVLLEKLSSRAVVMGHHSAGHPRTLAAGAPSQVAGRDGKSTVI
jgi:hypothetical protein